MQFFSPSVEINKRKTAALIIADPAESATIGESGTAKIVGSAITGSLFLANVVVPPLPMNRSARSMGGLLVDLKVLLPGITRDISSKFANS